MQRVLVVGAGSIGERHLRCFAATGRASVGLCEINAELRARVAERYGVADSFSSLEQALGMQWDAAVIATPAPSHVPIALQLVSRGVHLLVEKPLAVSTDGVAELIEQVRTKQRVAGVAYVYRAHPVLGAMRDAIQSGRFGEPVHLVVNVGQNFPHARPAYREIDYADRAKGGGAIQDGLTHLFNACEWLVGPIDRIGADAAHRVLEGVEVEDTVNVIARHGPVLACYSMNQHQAPTEVTITVACRRGTARFELHENRWRWMSEAAGAWNDVSFPPLARDDWFVAQANAFLDAVEGKAAPLCTLEEGLQTLRVNRAALASADSAAALTKIH